MVLAGFSLSVNCGAGKNHFSRGHTRYNKEELDTKKRNKLKLSVLVPKGLTVFLEEVSIFM